jgi:hypothetical protein
MLLLGQNVTIRVRLVNGKTGKPIDGENLKVWFNDSNQSNRLHLLRSDLHGVIKLSVSSDDSLSFASSFASSGFVTCHLYSKEEHYLRRYQVTEILEHGITDYNECSRLKFLPVAHPGEFLFFERPRTILVRTEDFLGILREEPDPE